MRHANGISLQNEKIKSKKSQKRIFFEISKGGSALIALQELKWKNIQKESKHSC